jgi:hypothetical protein
LRAAFIRFACLAALGGATTLACGAKDAAVSAEGGAPTTDGGGSEGACPATPTTLVDFPTLAMQTGASSYGATALAVGASNVYFVFGDALMRVPFQGGSVVTMLPAPVPTGLILQATPVLNGTRVFFHYPATDGSGEQIVGVPLEGGDASTNVTTSNGDISALAVDDQNVYFVDQDGVKSVPVGGGVAQVLTGQVTSADGVGFGGTLAVAGSTLYVTSTAQGGSVLSVPIVGGAPTVLAMQQPNASFLMPCGTDTCWWTATTPSGPAWAASGPGAIARLDGGQVTTLGGAPYFPWSVAFDGTNFYETVGCDACPAGSLVMIPASGAEPLVMGSASYLAVDGSCAFWSTTDGISAGPTSAAGQ